MRNVKGAVMVKFGLSFEVYKRGVRASVWVVEVEEEGRRRKGTCVHVVLAVPHILGI